MNALGRLNKSQAQRGGVLDSGIGLGVGGTIAKD